MCLEGCGLGRGVPLSNRLGSLGERRELRQWGPGQSPGRQRIFGIFEVHRTLLVGGGEQSQQSRLFPQKIHSVDDWGACPPFPGPPLNTPSVRTILVCVFFVCALRAYWVADSLIKLISQSSGGATPGRARSNDRPGSALPIALLYFGNM